MAHGLDTHHVHLRGRHQPQSNNFRPEMRNPSLHRPYLKLHPSSRPCIRITSDGFLGCDIEVAGGNFTCQCTKNGAFLFASDGSRVNITGGLVESNVATRRAGAVRDPAVCLDSSGGHTTTRKRESAVWSVACCVVSLGLRLDRRCDAYPVVTDVR